MNGLADMQREIGEWCEKTFPTASHGSITRHMEEEVRELAATGPALARAEEAADVLLILLHLAHRNSIDLLSEARAKFELVREQQFVHDAERGYAKRVKADAP